MAGLLSREEALAKVKDKLKNDRLVKHSLAVEAIMRRLAERLGEDENLWGLVGLLHDLDYEETSNAFHLHGLKTAEMLAGLLPEEALEAIKGHNELTGTPCHSRLCQALKASDQVSGLIVATALVMPGKKLAEVKVSSLKKKLKQKDFARGVRREDLALHEKLGLTLEDFLGLSLEALRQISSILGF
ncbi:MAG: HD domain-containing protein [Candidatus Hecatellaceae archaeon]